MSKICKTCGQEKENSEFYHDHHTRDGLQPECKMCLNKRSKAWAAANPEKVLKSLEKYRTKNKDIERERMRKWHAENPEKVKESTKRWHQANHKRVMEKHRIWKAANLDKVRANYIRQNIKKRSTIKGRLNNNISTAIRHSLKKGVKAYRSWESLVGYTVEELRIHLESQFDDAMTWENHGTYWHIDHKIPLAAFYFEKPEDPDFKRCWSLRNLQPLEAIENIRKGSKVDEIFKQSLTLSI